MGRRRQRKLRSGFTTGTAAAAATKAALGLILEGKPPKKVVIQLLTGDAIEIDVHRCDAIDAHTAYGAVIKDGGDDPDVTNKAEIGAKVAWQQGTAGRTVVIRGGRGVGMVTKPGLDVPPGEAAINPGPRKMITQAAVETIARHGLYGSVDTEIIVPRGKALARHTLNARLGIVGGISILGTTGVVRPLSHEAYVATVQAALSVASASGNKRVVLTTGRRSERYAQALWPDAPVEAFVQIGDYFAKSLEMAAAQGIEQISLGVFFGKAVKMAQAIPHTHARSARLTLELLAQWAIEVTGRADLAKQIAKANTARHALEMFKDDHPELIEKVGREILASAATFAGAKITIGVVIFDFNGEVLFEAQTGDHPSAAGKKE